jgi:hypothetical protein
LVIVGTDEVKPCCAAKSQRNIILQRKKILRRIEFYCQTRTKALLIALNRPRGIVRLLDKIRPRAGFGRKPTTSQHYLRLAAELDDRESTIKTSIVKKGALLAVSLSAALICGTAVAQSSTVSFTASYQGRGANSTSCSTTDQISGMGPAASGKYPVFVFTVGTTAI